MAVCGVVPVTAILQIFPVIGTVAAAGTTEGPLHYILSYHITLGI